MSIVLAGILITMSGIAVVAMVVFGVIPESQRALQWAFLGIGWVFILFGMFVRWKGLKMERAIEERKKNMKQK